MSPTLLRFILAEFWISHWWFKVGYRGMAATQEFFFKQGLPTWLAWFVVSFEVVIAVCLVLGIYVSLVCLVSLPILLASMWIYRKNGFDFTGEKLSCRFCGLARKSSKCCSAQRPLGSQDAAKFNPDEPLPENIPESNASKTGRDNAIVTCWHAHIRW